MTTRNQNIEEKAWAIHRESIVIDGLTYAPALEAEEKEFGYFDELIKIGIAAGNMTVTGNNSGPLQGMKEISSWLNVLEKYSDKFMLVTTGKDIEKAKEQHKFGVIMGSQNADLLGDSLSLLPLYKKLGVRIIQFNYCYQNLLGEGCGERTDSGLSEFGLKVVEEMNRLKLIIDVSHCGDQTTMDAIKYSKDPVLATHSNPRGVVDHIRNKTDEHIKALAEKGGVIGLVPYCVMAAKTRGVRPTFEEFIDLVDYTVNLAGIDHVGIGLDLTPFEKVEPFMKWAKTNPGISLWGTSGFFSSERKHIFSDEKDGHQDVGKLIEITKELLKRDYSDQEVKKILGLNFLRVFKQVWGE